MQLKLLNLYKMLSNIATSLVGAFIPLIVYNETGSMLFGVLALILQFVPRIVCNIVCKKWYYTKPQLVLLLRVIPIVLYSVCIILIDYVLWVGIIGSCVFYGISESFKSIPREVVYNYSSLEENSGGLGFSRLLEQIGKIAALIIGGYMLDISKVVVTIISLVIYLISVVPLVIYYFKSKNSKTFNRDFTSNAYESMKKNADSKDLGKKISRKLLNSYGWLYFIYSFIDALSDAFVLHLAVKGITFTTAGLFSAVYNATYGIGSYVFGKINDKKDTTWLIVASCIVIAGCCATIGFVFNEWVLYILFGLIGFLYSFLPVYVLQNLLAKCRIMGVSNESLYIRENTSNFSVIGAMVFGLFGPVWPVFIAIAVTMGAGAYLIPANEENTRKMLVNYLQHNEVVYEKKRAHRNKKLQKNNQ